MHTPDRDGRYTRDSHDSGRGYRFRAGARGSRNLPPLVPSRSLARLIRWIRPA
jgi:hypothetical protein